MKWFFFWWKSKSEKCLEESLRKYLYDLKDGNDWQKLYKPKEKNNNNDYIKINFSQLQKILQGNI